MTFEEVLKAEQKMHPADKRPVVGWLCSYTPEEIIEAAGFRPFRILPRPEPAPSIDSHVACNLCSRVKNCLGHALDGCYDFMKGMVAVFSCNAMTHMYNIWKEYVKNIFIYNLEVPVYQERKFGSYMEKELAAMFTALSHKAGMEPDYDALHGAILARLETMRLLSRMQKLRVMENPPVSGAEAARIVEMASTTPRDVFNRALKNYLLPYLPVGEASKQGGKNEQVERIELAGQVEQAGRMERAGQDVRPSRILITGGLIPRFLVEMVEECGGLVVVEDGCNGYRYFAGIPENGIFLDKEETLLRYLAGLYIKRPPCSRMHGVLEQRCREIAKLAAQYRVEGVIHYSLKFCDCNLYDYPAFKDEVVGMGIPFLRLEGEEQSTGTGQLKTRIQAFLEMVR